MKKYPELEIGTKVLVIHRNDTRIYELNDIAIWKHAKTIKTIDIEEVRLPYFASDEEKKEFDIIRKSCEIRLRHEDKLIIKTDTDSRIYQVMVHGRYNNNDEIGRVYFNKVMNVACRG